MTKKILIILLLFISVSAQTGITRYYHLNGNPESEISMVNDVFVGTSYWYYENGNLKSEKTYSNGKLNGWVREYFETGLLKEEYHVKNGVKDGLHKEYYENGGLKSVNTYEDGVLVKEVDVNYDSYYQAAPEAYLAGNRQYEIQKRKGDLLCDADICPIPIGGMNAIQDSIKYPEHAKLYGLEGIVILIAQIDINGDVLKTEIIESLGLGCDEEAQRVVKSTKFIPGQRDFKPVVSNLSIRVVFSLTDKTTLAGNYAGQLKREIYRPLENTLVKESESAKPEKQSSRDEDKICNLEICPKPRGGLAKLLSKISIPPTAARLAITGIVIVDVDVDEYGFVRDTKIIGGPGYGIENAVEEALFSTEFDPGMDKGQYKRTTVRMEIPITKR